MGDDHHSVPRQVQIRLDGVAARLDGALEGPHRVLRVLVLVPAVGDGLGETHSGPIGLGADGMCWRAVSWVPA